MPTGELVDHGPTTSFRPLDRYLLAPDRPVLGQIFEDQPDRHWTYKTRVHPWFANLLPEGELRAWLSQRLDVSEVHDLPLLLATGTDLPGAVTVEPLAEGAEADEIDDTDPPTPHGDGGDDDEDTAGLRMSIAGFQLKLSMLNATDGKGLTLAGSGRLGGHLVKLPARGYHAVPENEFATMRWADASGIDIPEVSLVAVGDLGLPEDLPVPAGANAFVIRRFDRKDAGGRVHIEDFNQVVGTWPKEKYKGESYESVGAVLLRTTDAVDDLWEYVRRLVFIVASGNEDAHKKNWSLRYEDGRRPRLSPAYDLVSTVQYEGLKRSLALNLGGSKDFADVTIRSLDRLAIRVDVEVAEMRAFVNDAAEKTIGVMPDYLDEMPDRERLLAHVRGIPLFEPSLSGRA